MCKETFDVVGLNDTRTAYEVEEFLLGVPSVTDAQADIISDEIVVEYDETQISQDDVLDSIEHAGCKPSNRIDGLFDKLRTRLSYA